MKNLGHRFSAKGHIICKMNENRNISNKFGKNLRNRNKEQKLKN